MKKKSIILALAILTTAPSSFADGLSCVEGYFSPSARSWNYDVVISTKNYREIKDPLGNIVRDYRGAGSVVAAEIAALETHIDRAEAVTLPLHDRVSGALEFANQLNKVALILFKQSEMIAEDEICNSRDSRDNAMAFVKMRLKSENLALSVQVANKYLHRGEIGSMKGIVGQLLTVDPAANLEISKMQKQGLLRIRQYYYLLLKSSWMQFRVANTKANQRSSFEYVAHPQIQPQIERLKEAFQVSRAEMSFDPMAIASIDEILRDLSSSR